MQHPTKAESRYLSFGYGRFYDLFEEIMDSNFFMLDSELRFYKIKDIFSVYSELIKYEPIKHLITNDSRPYMELLARDFVKFIRNILSHFPFFIDWDSLYIDQEIVTAIESSGSIDRFLSKEHPHGTKFRVWDAQNKAMFYVDLNLNTGYVRGDAVFLSDILNEQEGVRFICLIMRNYLDTQVLN